MPRPDRTGSKSTGRTLACVQLPTTLPTLDELLGRTINGTLVTPANIAALLLGLTEQQARPCLHAACRA